MPNPDSAPVAVPLRPLDSSLRPSGDDISTISAESDDSADEPVAADRAEWSQPDTAGPVARGRLPIVQRDHYVTQQVIGRGGLGRVTQASDTRLERSVAIKELHHIDPAVQTRFLREALITARLQHPSIVPVYEAGYWPDGRPFYAMKLIEGSTIAQLLREADDLDGRLRYLPNAIAVADAIAYAHSQRIIHRDLKPSNIVIGEFGETMVVDWGLAKDLDAPSGERSLPRGISHDSGAGLTQAGSIMGTPSYMPPEQARGADLVDERADIYALGAMLYHIVAGHAPYRGTSTTEILDRLDQGALAPLAEKAEAAPSDLIAIVERAMSRQPDMRYQTAKALADDLRRFQSGQRVSVHQYSVWALLSRFVARHRAAVIVVSVLLLALATTAVVSVQRVVAERNVARERSIQAERSRGEARKSQQQAQERSEALTVAQAALSADPTASVAWLTSLPARSEYWRNAWQVAVEAQIKGIARHVWRDHIGVLFDLHLSPDGTLLGSASQHGTIQLRDLQTQKTALLRGHSARVTAIAFSPVHPVLASASADKTVRIWTLSGGLVETIDVFKDRVDAVKYSSDGQYLAAGDWAGTVYLRSNKAGVSNRLSHHSDGVTRIAFSPRSTHLATGGLTGEVYLQALRPAGATRDQGPSSSLVTPARRLTAGRGQLIYDLKFSPRGDVLASGSRDGKLHLWQVESGRKLAEFTLQGAIKSLAFSPDGALLASA
ncbi:MAG: serine/threonine-protein kinase, partial [Myxococcota bacterium]